MFVSWPLQRLLPLSEMVERVLSVLHPVVAFGGPAYLLVRHLLLKDPTRVWLAVLTPQECRQLRDWLRTGIEPTDAAPMCLTDFASPELLDTLVEMNHTGFKDSAFEVERERLLRRNKAWIEKNPRIFQLMRDPRNQKEYIGYSSLVPLNAEGADLYLEGSLKDADIKAALICGPGERPSAILAFAIVLRQEFSFTRSGAAREYSPYFWTCIRKHVRELYPHLFEAGDYPPIYAQAERSRMKDRLKSIGFKPTGLPSADGFELWVLENAARPVLQPPPAVAGVTQDPALRPVGTLMAAVGAIWALFWGMAAQTGTFGPVKGAAALIALGCLLHALGEPTQQI
jgi:hypothetical protein